MWGRPLSRLSATPAADPAMSGCGVCVCACVRACGRACVRGVCVRAYMCARACARARACVHARVECSPAPAQERLIASAGAPDRKCRSA